MKRNRLGLVVLLSICASTAAYAQAPSAQPAAPEMSVDDLLRSAQTYEKRKNWKEAEYCYEKIVQKYQKEKVKNFPFLYQAYSGLGGVDLKLQDLSGADLNYREALAAAVNVYGPGNAELIKPLTTLAQVCYAQKKYSDSGTYLRQALALAERKGGPEDVESISIREKLAETLERSGNYKECESLIKQSLLLRDKIGDHSSAQVLALLNCYSDILHKTDRASEAEQIDYQVDQIHAGKVPPTTVWKQ
ncbi:MAG TPA: tetratricopeptide repeat protein [Drouetiella sp.]|jgi:tetratricopeptide (TPR) repeat protein